MSRLGGDGLSGPWSAVVLLPGRARRPVWYSGGTCGLFSSLPEDREVNYAFWFAVIRIGQDLRCWERNPFPVKGSTNPNRAHGKPYLETVQFLTVMASELTAFLPVTPSRPANKPRYSLLSA